MYCSMLETTTDGYQTIDLLHEHAKNLQQQREPRRTKEKEVEMRMAKSFLQIAFTEYIRYKENSTS